MSYRKIGDLIQVVDQRNRDLAITNLVGLTINKKFIPSVANIIGTDMANYKLIRKNQFACSTMQVRRDKKMPIALLKEFEIAIISQAYPVFEVIDENLILPDYLMLWFSRSEFDREACFHAVGGVRGSLEWEDFCGMQLPVPSIEEQRQIVAQYHSIANKIKVNEQICEKLEATAQALYKHWFVDFEFPNGEGKPYKYSDGKMVWKEELGKEIPEGWEVGILKDIFDNFDSKRKPITASDRIKEKGLYPYYGAAALMDYIDDYIFDGTYILLGEDGTVMNNDGSPVLQYVWGKFWVNNHAHVLKGKNGFDENSLYLLLKNTNVSDIITGGVQLKINQGNLNNLSIIKPSENLLLAFNKEIYTKFEIIKNYKEQNQKLTQLQSLLLSRLAVGEEVGA